MGSERGLIGDECSSKCFSRFDYFLFSRLGWVVLYFFSIQFVLSRVGIVVPKIEVQFEHISGEGDAYVGTTNSLKYCHECNWGLELSFQTGLVQFASFF